MSNVRGRIAVDVQFTDSTTASGVQSLKTITLQDATEYTTGKVAVVTGTAGTGAVSIDPASLTFRDASGQLVSFAQITRVAFSATGSQLVEVRSNDSGERLAASKSSSAAVCDCSDVGSLDIGLATATAGTASFTLVLYGS